jgi:hypothetical protein
MLRSDSHRSTISATREPACGRAQLAQEIADDLQTALEQFTATVAMLRG